MARAKSATVAAGRTCLCLCCKLSCYCVFVVRCTSHSCGAVLGAYSGAPAAGAAIVDVVPVLGLVGYQQEQTGAKLRARPQSWNTGISPISALKRRAATSKAACRCQRSGKLLGHTSLTTTYLKTLRREFHQAVQTREAAEKWQRIGRSDGTEARAQPPETPPKY
jgi:hypothetical protein